MKTKGDFSPVAAKHKIDHCSMLFVSVLLNSSASASVFVNSCVMYSLILSVEDDRSQFSSVFLSCARLHPSSKDESFFRLPSRKKSKKLITIYCRRRRSTRKQNNKLERLNAFVSMNFGERGRWDSKDNFFLLSMLAHFMHPHPATRKSEKKIGCVFHWYCSFCLRYMEIYIRIHSVG